MSDSVDLADLERELTQIGMAIERQKATLPEDVANQKRINLRLRGLLRKIEEAQKRRKP